MKTASMQAWREPAYERTGDAAMEASQTGPFNLYASRRYAEPGEGALRIGIMLRHLDQHPGGVLVYTRNLLRELFRLAGSQRYYLLYQNTGLLGSHIDPMVAREWACGIRPRTLWDQVAVPAAERLNRLNVIFNPKYSIPLAARCPSVWVCHGLDWYVMPWGSRWFDRLNHRLLIPVYAKQAAAIIAVSETTRQHVIEYLKVSPERVHTIHSGVSEAFRSPISADEIRATKARLHFPEQYFLYVGQIYPPKNFGRLIQAYAKVGPRLGIPLVAVGGHTWLCEDEIALVQQLDLERWVLRPGWFAHHALPPIYQGAAALLMPSLYESFALPVLEAMAAGCPVVTADRHGTREIAGDAALLVDPEDVDSIADGMERIVSDPELRRQQIAAGRARARELTWRRCAEQTLAVLKGVAA
jgi:glycosyltransferase involved in cell wall biosynthesis